MKTKQNISDQPHSSEILPPTLEKLKQPDQGIKVPDGYFDSLSPRIVDEINKRKNRSFIVSVLPAFGKPFVWAPVIATVIVAILFIFIIPLKKESAVPVYDEWTEISMAYDESYAEEALFAESNKIDAELDKADINFIKTASFSAGAMPTDEEITEYLKDQDIDTELLTVN